MASKAELTVEAEFRKAKLKFETQYRFALDVVGHGPGLRERLKKVGLHDWKLDFAFPKTKTFVEIQGHGFGHSGRGAVRDYQKHNALMLLGWRGLYYPAFTANDRPDIIIEDLEKLWSLPG